MAATRTATTEKTDIAQLENAVSYGEDLKSEPGRDYSGATAVTDPAEIALIKKIDRRLMPMLFIMYWFNYLDRNAIASARLNHLEKDLKLKGSQYNTCISILFVGYLLGQVPSNMLMTRIRPSIYMGAAMMLWAVVSGLAAVAHDFKGMLLARFFLGVTEAPFYPGALYMIAMFYKRKEIATRISILYCGNILATAFAGLIAAGVFEGLDGVRGLAGWRWLFILIGATTFVTAAVGIFVLPDRPETTWWLTPEERELAALRIKMDTVHEEEGGTVSVWKGLRQSLADPRLYLFAFMQNMHLSANGFKNFFPSVVATLGYNTTITLVLTCPPYLIAGIISVAYSVSSGRFNERTWHITASKAVAVFGFALACGTLHVGARYFAMVVFCIGTYGVNSIILGWVGTSLAQTTEKKAVSLAIVNTVANASFIYTPYLWPKSSEPRMILPLTTSIAFSVLCAVGAWAMRIWLKRDNKKLLATGGDIYHNLYAY